ncbi:MAG: ISAs1 family transposase [Verrucomicrobia bacterium]|nr:ISAs1 family transposase [Verrucomicrobiota bacterium]
MTRTAWVALILWVGAYWHLRPRDQWVGWDAVTRSERLQLIVHQARFLVLQETRDSVWSSAVLSASLRDLPKQWEEVFDYRPLLVETFTDPETHEGTCYKAAGWEAVGMSLSDGKHYADVFSGVARPKKLWLKALEPRAREKLCATEVPAAQQKGLAAHAGVRCALKAPQLFSLYDVMRQVPDPRRRNARRYPIGAVLTLVALGLLRGAVHLATIVRTAQKLTQGQRKQLRLPFKKGTRFHSVPCYDVFRDVLRGIDLQGLAESLTRWLQSQAGELPRTLAVDGKTIRDHLGLIVALVDTEEGTPVALAANVKGKGHELKTTQELLSSPGVNLLNATVTADSLHCQDQTAHIITREKGGDYLLQVRDNQPTLRALAEKQLERESPLFLPPTGTTDEMSCAN